MTTEEIFAAWAPAESTWSPWVKPVLFASMAFGGPDDAAVVVDADWPWVPPIAERCALVLDLPGATGVDVALALAKRGYQPVPLYSGCVMTPGRFAPMVVEVLAIRDALVRAAAELARQGSAPDAPPAFMLDSQRRVGRATPQPGWFDNRSVSLPTDFPSANMLLSHGVTRCVLVQEQAGQPQADLAHTLRRWQEQGIGIASTSLDSAGPAEPITITKPAWYRWALWQALALLGLKRNLLGGFGGVLPAPSAG